MDNYAELKAENNRLKYKLYVTQKEKDRWNSNCNTFYNVCKKQYQVLQEIKAIAEQMLNNNEFVYQNHRDIRQIVRLITKAEGSNV